MSLSSLARPASHAIVRQHDPLASAVPVPPPLPVKDGFDSLIRYIPTETVTIFVALCGALQAIEVASRGAVSLAAIYWGGAVATPIVLFVISYGRHRSSGGSVPLQRHPWPYVAATIAFMVWALSVPGVVSMITEAPSERAAWSSVAALGAIVVSLTLSMLEPVFGPRRAG